MPLIIIIIIITLLIIILPYAAKLDVKEEMEEQTRYQMKIEQEQNTLKQIFDEKDAERLTYEQLKLINANLSYLQDKQDKHFKKINKRLENIQFYTGGLFLVLVILPIVLTILSVIAGANIIQYIFNI